MSCSVLFWTVPPFLRFVSLACPRGLLCWLAGLQRPWLSFCIYQICNRSRRPDAARRGVTAFPSGHTSPAPSLDHLAPIHRASQSGTGRTTDGRGVRMPPLTKDVVKFGTFVVTAQVRRLLPCPSSIFLRGASRKRGRECFLYCADLY
jgi:hypothetical protein